MHHDGYRFLAPICLEEKKYIELKLFLFKKQTNTESCEHVYRKKSLRMPIRQLSEDLILEICQTQPRISSLKLANNGLSFRIFFFFYILK